MVAVVCAAVTMLPTRFAVASVLSPQEAVDEGVSAAARAGVHQYVALVDKATGKLVASSGGDVQVISESIVKLFTVAYYLVQYGGHVPDGIAADLHEMIVHSNDALESQYWTTAAVPSMAARFGLEHTSNGAKTGPHDWGWEYITADDEATFLYRMSVDPVVGPFLTDAMAGVASVGADGFDQNFGFNSLTGPHGSKQGWTDLDTSAAINIHSVGWTDRYFGAILETSDSPQYDTMRADSTVTAQLVAALGLPNDDGTAGRQQAAAQQAAQQQAAERRAAAARAAAEQAAQQQESAALTMFSDELRALVRHLLEVIG